MKLVLSLTFLCCASCAAPTSSHSSIAAKDFGGSGPSIAADPFPLAKEGFKLAPSADAGPKLSTLFNEMERVTGVHFLVDQDVQTLLLKAPVRITSPLDVPAPQAWPVFESILAFNQLVLKPLNMEEPRLIGVRMLTGPSRASVTDTAMLIRSDELSTWARHPACLVTTMLDLESVDVRDLSNSIRQVLNDTNTAQVVPAGNTNLLIVTGLGPKVSALCDQMQRCNESERKRLAEVPKRSVPGVAEPAPKSEAK
jgi:hypothetical protein